jgi:hypothetical protein
MTLNIKDAAAGVVFIVLGLVFGAGALMLPLGTAWRMGPGYFPLILCGLMVLLGIIIAVRAIGVPSEALGPVPWRGFLFVLPGAAIFGWSVRGLGLMPSIFIISVLAAFASRRTTPLFALVLGVVLTVFCTGVFYYGLGLPVRLFGPWLGF